jgi:hypothetical protein
MHMNMDASSIHTSVAIQSASAFHSSPHPSPFSSTLGNAAPSTHKRHRNQSSSDGRISPFTMLELLTSEFDAGTLLREVVAAGFTVPLLERIDASISDNAKSRLSHARTPTLYYVHTSSDGQLEPHRRNNTGLLENGVSAESGVRSTHLNPKRHKPSNAHRQQASNIIDAPHAADSISATVSRATHASDADMDSANGSKANPPVRLGVSSDTDTSNHAIKQQHASSVGKKSTRWYAELFDENGYRLPERIGPSPSLPTLSHSRTNFPFLHIDADSILFRKADVPSINWANFKRRTDVIPSVTVPVSSVSAPLIVTPSAPPTSADGARIKEPAVIAASEPSDSDTTSHVQLDPSPPSVSFEEVAAGLTKRQARFLHTSLTPTNILPGSRRSAGKPTLLPWERVDWKGRMKEE